MKALPFVRSWHSLHFGTSSPADLAREARESGYEALILADRNSLCAAPAFEEACAAEGIEPLFGAEILVAESYTSQLSEKGRGQATQRGKPGSPSSGTPAGRWQSDPASDTGRILLVAQDRAGFGSLCRILSFADWPDTGKACGTENGGGRAGMDGGSAGHLEPGHLPMAAARGTFCASGSDPRQGQIPVWTAAALVGALEGGAGQLLALSDHEGFLEEAAGRIDTRILFDPVHPPLRAKARRLASRKIPAVACPEIVHTGETDRLLQRLLVAIGSAQSIASIQPKHLSPQSARFQEAGIIAGLASQWPGSLEGAEVLRRATTMHSLFSGWIFPPHKSGAEAPRVLRHEVLSGATARYGEAFQQIRPGILARIKRELAIIEAKGFSSYFLVVRDIVRMASRSCGRGSAAASIVSYCLGLTDVDPVAHDLYFDRFLNPGRSDPPDIDVDFAWDERDAILDTLLACHGTAKAARVGTQVCFQPRSAIRETARAFGIPEGEISLLERSAGGEEGLRTTFQNLQGARVLQEPQGLQSAWGALSTMLNAGSGDQGSAPTGDHKASAEAVPQQPGVPLQTAEPLWATVLALASRIVGFPRHLGVHSGGIVIVPDDLSSHVPLLRTGSGIRITAWDKDGVEAAGLVKIDLLGNRSLAVVRDALASLKTRGIAPGRDSATSSGQSSIQDTPYASAPSINSLSSCIPDNSTCPLRDPVQPPALMPNLNPVHIVTADRTRVSCQSSLSPPRTPLPSTESQPVDRNKACVSHTALSTQQEASRLAPSTQTQSPCARPLSGLPGDPEWDPLTDSATIDLLARGDTMGVFYMESPAMRMLQRKTGCGDFAHLVIHSSIIRPAANRFINEYIDRLKGKPYRPLHPLLGDILAETFGIMCYQEDVCKVATALAGFSPSEADSVRKVLSKKDMSSRIGAWRDKFRIGATASGVDATTIDEIWQMIESFAGYSFVKAHSASYAMLSFRSAWLRAHYGAEFMAAVISNRGGYYSTLAYASEARRMGLHILPPDVQTSHRRCDGYGQNILFGLDMIAGLGSGFTEVLLCERETHGPFKGPEDFIHRLRPTRAELEALSGAGALDSLDPLSPRPRLLMHLLALCASQDAETRKGQPGTPEFDFGPGPEAYGAHMPGKDPQQRASGKPIQEPAADRSLPTGMPEAASTSIGPFSRDPIRSRLEAQMRYLGTTLEVHPLTLWPRALARPRVLARDLSALVGTEIQLLGWPVTAKYVLTSQNEVMEFVSLEDETALYEAVLFPDVHKRYRHLLFRDEPLLVRGTVQEERGAISIEVHSLEPETGSPVDAGFPRSARPP